MYDSIAVSASINNIHIYDKKGNKTGELTCNSENQIIDIDWDSNGETLAILQDNYEKVTVWHVSLRQYTSIEGSNSKDRCCFIKWGKNVPTLAIGTDKGVITFYSKTAKRKIPCVNKHSKKIIAWDWNSNGQLLTVGSDKTITLSNSSGDTLMSSTDFKYDPKNIAWSTLKVQSLDREEKIFSLVYQGNIFLLFKYDNLSQPNNIDFPQKYGTITKYLWYGEGYAALGFSNGYLQIILTGNYNEAETLVSQKVFNSHIQDMAINESRMKIAIACFDSVKIYSLSTHQELKQDKISIKNTYGKIESLAWTNDGQILSVATNQGMILNFIMYVPELYSAHGQVVVFMTSLYEARIVNSMENDPDKEELCKLKFEKEPSNLRINEYYVIAVFNTEYIVFQYKDLQTNEYLKESKQVFAKDSNASIIDLCINQDFVVTFLKNSITIEDIHEGNLVQNFLDSVSMSSLPANIAVANEFLYIADDSGTVFCYHVYEQSLIGEYKMDFPVLKMYPNESGTKLILHDSNKDLFMWSILYNQVFKFDEKIVIQDVSWNSNDSDQFLIQVDNELIPFIFIHQSIDGPYISHIKNYKTLRDALENEDSTLPNITSTEKDLKMISFLDNQAIMFSSSDNGVRKYVLSSHSWLDSWSPSDDEKSHLRHFLQNLALYDLKEAMKSAKILDNYEVWKLFNKFALNIIELDIAECCNLFSKNIGYVLEIKALKREHELNVILGKICSILNRSDQAQEYFLKSTKPTLALDMRCDLQDYKIAYMIAEKISPNSIPNIGRKLGLQLEIESHYNDALKIYESSYLRNKSLVVLDVTLEEHNLQCQAGIARCCIRLGNITRGLTLANELKDTNIIMEIASVCESINQFNEAAELFEKLQNYEKAAQLYIEQKNYKKAFQYSEFIKTPKLLIKLAQAKEEQGKFEDAEKAYEKANDYENVIRLNLKHLNNPEKAKHILRNLCSSAYAAEMMAYYCEEKGWKRESVEFLIVAGKYQQSYLLAQMNDEMETYANMIEQRLSNSIDKYKEEFQKIAEYYEGKNDYGRAARTYMKQGNPKKALKLYLKSGEEYLNECIEMVGKENDENLINTLLNYLMGEVDNTPKEPIYLLKLYLILKNFKQTSKIAIIIANGELENGNYKVAHKFMWETINNIKDQSGKVPLELSQKFCLVHSYIIVRSVIKLNDHVTAAKLLVRVSKNISSFGQHASNILTMAVVECTKAKMKAEAYKWASVVVKPEYRDQIVDNFKSKIENISKKPVQDADPQEETSPCYHCGTSIADSEMFCHSCQNNMMFCCASGMHLIKDQILACIHCKSQCNSSAITKWIAQINTCPVCEIDVTEIDYKPVDQKLMLE